MTIRGILFFLAGSLVSLGVASAQTTFTSTGGVISVTDNDSVSQPQAAVNGYPSAIVVPGTVTGTVSNITVRLNGLSASATGQSNQDVGVSALGILLVHKATGKNLEILSAPGDASVTFSGVTFNIDDSASAGFMPTNGDNCPPAQGVAFPSQSTYTYRPSSFEVSNALDTYSGSTGLSINRSGPCFATTLSTLNGVFDGVTAAGEWDLYVNNNGEFAEVTINSWSLILTTASAASTTTTLTSSVNPSFTGAPSNSTTLTATVTPSVSGGTVAFTDGGNPISGCGAVPVSGSVATCTTTFTTQGFHSLAANYAGTGSFGPSTGTLNQFVELHPTITGNQFCNGGGINIPVTNASGTDTQPYPSVMSVSGYPVGTTVSTVQLVLNNTVSLSETVDISMLLVSPDGKALDFFDFIGGGVPTAITSVTFVDGPTGIAAPNGSGPLTNGASYEPTSYRSSPVPSFLNPPTPAPQVPNTFFVAAPGGGTGAKTFLQTFNGATANGAWSLYVYDHGNPNTTSIGGWCLTLTPATGTPTVTTVSGSPNAAAPSGAVVGGTVTVTAVVKSGGVGVTKGSVTFTDNGAAVAGATPSGPINVATSGPTQGQASFTTTALTEGDHNIQATYSDSTNSLNESFGSYVQRVDKASTVTVNGSTVTYCNAGPVTFPDGSLGAATPNPSNINVSNLPGTINTLTLTLNGYHESPSASFLDSVLIGPAGTKAASLDFFSGDGGSSGDGPFNLVFADGASAVPTGSFAAGTYSPTSRNTTNTYTSSISGFYTLPSTYNYAAPSGTSTFANIYNNSNPNGNWDLYFNQAGDAGGGGLNTGWCLNFIENAVTGTGTTAHAGPGGPGTNMNQGGTGTVTFSLLNNGDVSHNGSTGDPDGTVAHAMTVVGTLPSGLTFGTLPSGSPWNCGASLQLLTCTSTIAVAAGSSYPVLPIPVNVASSAGPTVTISGFTFSGAGMTGGTFASDTITINPAPVLGMTKSHTGTFTQGSTGTWTISVSNNSGTASGATNGTTVTVVDTLPTGYMMQSFTGTGWSCSGTGVVTCTSSQTVAGAGGTFALLSLIVNIPANSATSVMNNATVFGGGDLTHTNSGNGAPGSDTLTVVQVPATVNLTSGNNQSVQINTAFPTNFAVTVLDAGGVAINGATVTFTAPASGASGIFSGSTNVKTATTNASGLATATVYTANSIIGGYNISAAAGSITNNFSATNITGPPTSMTANAGTTPQTAAINTAFTNALAVTVKDAGSNPVSGVSVTFTAPGTGASGKFSNNTATILVVTNASGVAAAPFTANGTAGPYTVTAAATGLTTVNFSLTNSTGAASSMTANAGTTPQSATINTAFTNALAVTVKDAGSNPISGVNVTFTAPGTGASGIFSNSTATIIVATNASGVASAPFTANGTAGPYTVTATASGLTMVNFSLTNTAGAASSMTANAGTTPQSATINTAFANALAVTVKDAGSNPVSGVNVTFTAPGTGASGIFSNSTTTIIVATNASGVASAPFTANGTAGPYTVTATASGLTMVNFSLTNTGGVAASMTANAGTTPQSATINTAFANALAVTVKDAGSNPVSGVSVTFTAPGTGASGKFSNNTATILVVTNASGIASAPFTANGTAGPYTVTATASGLTMVNFSLTNSTGAASSMTANAGTTPQTATISTAFANALAVTVKDAGSNPVSGVNVTFTAPGTGASGLFSNSTATITVATNASGVAAAPFTANGTAGPYTVTATASGLTMVNFSLTNTAGAASSMTANAGTTPQSATVNTAFANALAVTVKDAGSNPISGVNVTFTAPGSGASGTFSNSTATIIVATNASGVAAAPFTANGTSGPYTVTAAATGLTTVNFSLTNTAVVQNGPTVVSYSVLWGVQSYNVASTPTRNRLPWQITGIKVVFSAPITTGDMNSLSGTGLTTTGFSGLGTNTLTWTISPLAIGNFATMLAGSGADALKDGSGNALTNGAGFSQNLKILYGDFNDDGVVTSQDFTLVNAARSTAYNIFADMNGDGVVDVNDVQIVRTREGTSLP